MEGLGLMVGEGEKYEGEFVGGLKEGYGEEFGVRSGGGYKGGWKGGKKNGKGVLEYSNGSVYTGEFLDG